MSELGRSRRLRDSRRTGIISCIADGRSILAPGALLVRQFEALTANTRRSSMRACCCSHADLMREGFKLLGGIVI